ncbi:MAG: peptide chain release factor N(5)-glutamine methyltransferase [Candidatus Omnitrophica bacterium]|nr:peptide chain release factor N(5)-glutamine methyltransferase [Candidatus Omnitrophota bacterium]
MNDTTPIQYEEAKALFMGMEVKVDRRVLIPRPETELLVMKAVDLCRKKGKTKPKILDAGTGSGIISLGIAKLTADCKIIAADISKDALSVAEENFKKFGSRDKIKSVISDWFSYFTEEYNDFFDLIVSNPPYVSEKDFNRLDPWVKAEPRLALYAGKEGMDCLNVVISGALRLLAPGGSLSVEVGYDQARKVKNRFSENGFISLTSSKDFNGYERVITGFKNG